MMIKKSLLALAGASVLVGSVFAKEDPKKPHVGSTAPPLTPAESEKKFAVPPGFEVRLFAAEPDIKNPAAMAFDEKGRLWVVELIEYPNGAKEGTKGRDVVKCLQDTDGDGRADKVTVFADGLSLATAVLPGNGGVYVGQAPHFFFYPIVSDGPDGPKAGERQTLLTGFGLQDRHELLNSFCWGPDGYLYMTQGVFTSSLVKDPKKADDQGIRVDATVARYHPRTGVFENWADGISNQWGVDWDVAGNAFVSACVVDHIWHTAPGGVYNRQGGKPNVQHTYELLRPINKDKHRHYMAAYGGISVYNGHLFPKEYVGTVFMGNIHGNNINHDKLTPDGASWSATDLKPKDAEGDFLEANDDWFRPVNEQVGPDGALWIMDWYDKYPCYQNRNAPDLDRERGRIWRVVYTGNEKGKPISAAPVEGDLSKLGNTKLVELLSHPNGWHRRHAQRLLTERKAKVGDGLLATVKGGKTLEAKMASVYSLLTTGSVNDVVMDDLSKHADAPVRAWAARFVGETLDASDQNLARLNQLATDKDAQVRSFVAWSLRRIPQANTLPTILTLLAQPGTDADPILPFMIWMAAEAKVADDPKPVLDGLRADVLNTPAAPAFVKKVFRRIADTKDPAKLDQAVAFLGALENDAVITAAIDGILESKQTTNPNVTVDQVLAKLQANKDKEVSTRAARLAAVWGNTAAASAMLKSLADPNASAEDRARAIRVARELKTDEARKQLAAAVSARFDADYKLDVIRALGEVGGADNVADTVLAQWKDLSPTHRRDAADVLATRAAWAKKLLEGVKQKAVQPTDISVTAVRTMSAQPDLRKLIAETVGPFRESPADKVKLIADKKQMVINGPVDMKLGHEMATKTCLVCHQLYGEGATPNVGPDLTGVGRASIDALLANVIDPNQIIGKGYENTIIETKDGETITGRLTDETPDLVKVLSQGPVEHTIKRTSIKKMRTEPLSVMPEGLEQLKDDEFRSLIWYVLAPPGDDKVKKMRLVPGEKELTIKAKLGDEMAELLVYRKEEAAVTALRDPSMRNVVIQSLATALPPAEGLEILPRAQFKRFGEVFLQEAGNHATWTAEADSQVGAGTVAETTTYTVRPPSKDAYEVDVEWTLTAKQTVQLSKGVKSGLVLQTASAANPAKVTDGTWHLSLGDAAGLAAIEHPSNPVRSTVAASGNTLHVTPLEHGLKLNANKPVTFRYRLVISRGAIDPKRLADRRADFASLVFEPAAQK